MSSILLLHQNGIIHGDIKPSNIAVRSNSSQVVLFDFGLSVFSGESPYIKQFRAQLKRNPRYLSINSIKTQEITPEDDYLSFLYSLADFYEEGLPWDGFATEESILKLKEETDLIDLLPQELHFLVLEKENGLEQLIEKLNETNLSESNKHADIYYLFGPRDPDKKIKQKTFVHEEKAPSSFKKQHSA